MAMFWATQKPRDHHGLSHRPHLWPSPGLLSVRPMSSALAQSCHCRPEPSPSLSWLPSKPTSRAGFQSFRADHIISDSGMEFGFSIKSELSSQSLYLGWGLGTRNGLQALHVQSVCSATEASSIEFNAFTVLAF
jgi:hypothetical protein